MMEMIAGNPFLLVLTSGIITAILVFMYFQVNDTRLIPFIVTGVALTLAPILIDSMIETDDEAVRGTVHRLARAVRQNDVPAALEFTHPDSKIAYSKIQGEMPTYVFSMCSVSGFRQIEFNDDHSEAVAKFRVLVNVRAPRFGHEGMATRGMTLNLRKTEDGDWKIIDYSHYPAFGRSH